MSTPMAINALSRERFVMALVLAGCSGVSQARRGQQNNDHRHRAAPDDASIFQDRIAAPVHDLVRLTSVCTRCRNEFFRFFSDDFFVCRSENGVRWLLSLDDTLRQCLSQRSNR
jgi:hypothetical protein